MLKHPIVLSVSEVQDILAGRKTKLLREVAKKHIGASVDKCPLGKVGGQLWGLEPHWKLKGGCKKHHIHFVADGVNPNNDGSGREFVLLPASRLYKWYSRIRLEITNVAVERLQENGKCKDYWAITFKVIQEESCQ